MRRRGKTPRGWGDVPPGEAIAAGFLAGRMSHRNLAAIVPLVVAFVVLAGGPIAHYLVWGRVSWAPWLPILSVVCATALGVITTLHEAKARHWLDRVRAVCVVAVPFLAFGITVVVGAPMPWFLTQVFGAVALAVWVQMPRMPVVRGLGNDSHGQQSPLEALGLASGTRGHLVEATDTTKVSRVRHAGGQSTEELQGALRGLESMAGLRRGSLRAVAEGSADQSRLTFTQVDILAQGPIPWPGPSHPGGSISLPTCSAIRSDGSPVLEIHGRGHNLTTGRSRMGKGVKSVLETADMLTRTDVVVWLADPVKKWQTFGPVRSGIDWFAGTEREVKAMIRALLRLIDSQVDLLADLGYTEWKPECWTKHRIPLLVVKVEEAGWLVEMDQLVAVLERAASAGIFVYFSLQRATYDRINTTVRSQFAGHTVFGVTDLDDAAYGMPDSVMATGIRPDLFGDEDRGRCYIHGPGISLAQAALDCRAFLPVVNGREDWAPVRAAVEAYAGMRATLHPAQVKALGEAYANRDLSHLIPSGRGEVLPPVPPTPAPAPAAPTATATGRVAVLEPPATRTRPSAPAGDNDQEEDETLGGYEHDLDPELDGLNPRVPITADVPDLELATLGTPGPVPSRQEQEEHLRVIIAGFVAEGRVTFETGDLLARWFAIPGITDGQRPALYRRLQTLMDDGQVERVDGERGVYRLLPGAGTRAVATPEGDDDEEFFDDDAATP